MASTYSSSLLLELMATGDQSGTWGDTTNTNLGTLLEQAITGVLSVAQGDVANLTLTSTNGASDQARNAVVNLTGAMTAARNVVVPTANKLYFVKNSTTGGYAVTVKTAAGTGIAIPATTGRWVYCDGTNVVDMYSGAFTPTTNDATSLGLSATAWSDLFLASGAVINFNAGNYTITHSASLLTFSGPVSLGTSNALTVGSIELGAATDTTISRSAAGVIAVEGVPLYSNTPINSQSAAYTTVLADAQKTILHPTADNNARVFTIDSNANVAFPIGTAITFVNQINTVTISITADTLTLAGAGTTGSRTLAANGMATALKIATTSWMISGAGLT